MPRRRKKKSGLAGKYVARRLILILMALVVMAGGFVALGYWLAGREQAEPEKPSQSAEQPSVSSSKPPEEPETPSEPSETQTVMAPARSAALDEWNMILVNKDHALPEDFQAEMEPVVGDYKVDNRILEPLLKMLAAAREDGISLIICSAYRTVDLQTTNFNNYKNNLISKGKNEEEAYAETAVVINPPGFSEHHTGLAIDFMTKGFEKLEPEFEDTPAFGWLSENAEKYGFVLRYPKDKTDITDVIYEPWHYRYVGVEHAAVMNAADLCLEEYVRMLEGGNQTENLDEPAGDEEAEPSDEEE